LYCRHDLGGRIGLRRLFTAGLDAELQRPDAQLVAYLERRRRFDRLIVENGAVATAQIAHDPSVIGAHNGAVASADCRAGCSQGTLARPPNDELVFFERDLRAFLRACQHNELQLGHRFALIRETHDRIKKCIQSPRRQSTSDVPDRWSSKTLAIE